MSLRARMFWLFGAVILALLSAEWWLLSNFRHQLRDQAVDDTLQVGGNVLGAIGTPVEPASKAIPPAPTGGDADASPIDAQDEPHAGAVELELERARSGGAVRASVRRTDGPSTGPKVEIPMMDLLPAIPVGGRSNANEATRPMMTLRKISVPTGTDDISRAFQTNILLGSMAILAVGLVASWLVAQRLTTPLRGLVEAADAVGAGRLGTQAEPVGEPQLDATIAAFNRMSTRLAELDAQSREVQARAHLTEIGEIARGIAHSLRNPLNALGLTLNELASSPGEAPKRDALAATCRTQIERIDRTLRSFLALASAGGERVLAEVDVVAVAQDVAMEATQMVGGRVRVNFEAGAERPTIRGIAAEVRTALHVLVVNAVEASRSNGSIDLRIARRDDAVQIVVEDEGPGLPPEVSSRLFQPHVTTKEQGAGLGLFLAQRIASRRYGGAISLERRSPRGLRAVLTLRDAHERGAEIG